MKRLLIDETECQFWYPTNGLRYIWDDLFEPHKKLQQLWQGSNGSQEWRDIDIVEININDLED